MKRLRFAFLLGLLGSSLLPGQVDISTGNLQINPVYNGQSMSSLGVGGLMRVSIDDAPSVYLSMASPVTVPVLAGNRKVTILSEWYEGPVSAYFNVAAGSTTPANIELSPVFGLVRGVLTENGGALPASAYTVAPHSSATPGPSLPGTGQFRMIAPAGSRNMVVRKNGAELLTVAYTAIAGQDVDLQTIDIGLATLTISPVYNGQSMSSLGVGGLMRLSIDDAPSVYLSMASPVTVPVLAGNRKVTILSEWYEGPVSAYFNVAAGSTTPANIELSPVFGLVRGVMTENGGALPASAYTVAPHSSATPGPSLPGTGQFRMIAPAGSRNMVVRKNGAELLTVAYTAIAGQDVDLQAIDIGLATLTLSPVYKGQSMSNLGLGGLMRVSIDDAPSVYLSMASPVTVPVLAGNRKMTILSEWYEGPVSAYFNVAAGSTSLANIELSPVFGLVRGVMTENGGALTTSAYRVAPHSSATPGPSLPGTGQFRMIAPAGSRAALVYKNGTTLFTFPYTAIAGQEVDLGSPGSMSFLGTIARTGTQASRTWNISLKNTANVAFLGTTAQLILTQLPGTTACSPTISAPNPVTYGDFAAGATITKPFVINFTGCPASPAASAAKFKVELQITSGSSTTRTTIAPTASM